jgi:hypothetical protein
VSLYWDSKAMRFRAESGRFVRKSAVTDAVESAIAETAKRLKSLSTRLQTGEISVSQWVLEARDTIKAHHTLLGGIANGGKAQMSPADWGKVGSQTKFQYEKLQAFAREIRAGMPLGKKFLNRITLYAEAGRSTYWAMHTRAHERAGFDEEMNVLSVSEHCEGDGSCRAETSRGWVKIGSLIPVGSRLCRARDRCAIEYRKAA